MRWRCSGPATLFFGLLLSTTASAQRLEGAEAGLRLAPTVRAPGEERGSPGGFRRPAPGTGLRATPEGRIFVLQRRTERAICETRNQIDRVQCQVGRLDGEVTQKSKTCRTLCGRIGDRKRDLERERERSRTIGLLGALFGVPAVAFVGLAQTFENDSSLRELNRQLASVQSEQRRIEQKISAYHGSKAGLERQLGELRTVEQTLVNHIASLKASLETQPASLEHARLRLETSRSLLGNLRGQVQTLETIHSSAAELGISLDGHIHYLKGELANADRLVQQSTRSYLEFLVRALVLGPERAAQQWLTKRVTSAVASGLQQAGLGREAAQYLAQRFIRSPRVQNEFVERVSQGL